VINQRRRQTDRQTDSASHDEMYAKLLLVRHAQ